MLVKYYVLLIVLLQMISDFCDSLIDYDAAAVILMGSVHLCDACCMLEVLLSSDCKM